MVRDGLPSLMKMTSSAREQLHRPLIVGTNQRAGSDMRLADTAECVDSDLMMVALLAAAYKRKDQLTT